MPAFETIKKRRDFLAVRGGEKASSSAFLIEAKRRRTDETAGREQTPSARFGFTITKKLGNAVRSNRIRRIRTACPNLQPASASSRQYRHLHHTLGIGRHRTVRNRNSRTVPVRYVHKLYGRPQMKAFFILNLHLSFCYLLTHALDPAVLPLTKHSPAYRFPGIPFS